MNEAVDWREWMRGLGRQLRRVREFLGLSQDQVARLAGVSQGAVSRLEAGPRPRHAHGGRAEGPPGADACAPRLRSRHPRRRGARHARAREPDRASDRRRERRAAPDHERCGPRDAGPPLPHVARAPAAHPGRGWCARRPARSARWRRRLRRSLTPARSGSRRRPSDAADAAHLLLALHRLEHRAIRPQRARKRRPSASRPMTATTLPPAVAAVDDGVGPRSCRGRGLLHHGRCGSASTHCWSAAPPTRCQPFGGGVPA